ncbi:MAG: PEP-CTERM sorting domain-containing protein [Thermoguttaceae bacterium]
MRRLLALSICVLSMTGASARADLAGTVTTGNLVVGSTVDMSNPDYNVVDIWLEDLTGPAAGSSVLVIGGTWTAVGGTMKVYADDASTVAFRSNTLLENGGGTYSGIDFPNYVGAFSRDGGTTNWSNTLYCDAWYCTGGDRNTEIYPISAIGRADLDGDGYANSLIGEFLVSKSTTNITFSGLGGPMDNGFCYRYGGGTDEMTSFSVPAPEPSTIALLGSGVSTMLAYAWRRRKEFLSCENPRK